MKNPCVALLRAAVGFAGPRFVDTSKLAHSNAIGVIIYRNSGGMADWE